jgi:hypothetical protein
MEVVCAAMTAPVSSKFESSVIAARMVASCQS